MAEPWAEHTASGEEDQALADVNSYIQEVFDILKREALKVRKEKEALDSVAKKLEHVHFAKTIKLNVGGQYFTTSLETLTKDPGSMLHAMFSGRFDTKPAEDGSYFIDRDGTHFRHILNYLRTGQLIVPKDEVVCMELLREAEFYQIQGILAELTRKPKPKPFDESVILSEEQRQKLVTWLGDSPQSTESTCSLLYRASRDGWAASNFHARCDNKGPTVTVVLSGTNIFGGFTETSWSGGDGHQACSKSFLFSLVNPVGVGPTKMALKADQKQYGIYCNSDYGPGFGGGSDLLINNAANSNTSRCSNLGHTYECPPNQSGTTFLTGQRNFTVNEYEVFGYQR